ncbi:MAG: response regulator transcription factor [Rhodomicrobium sp.]|nr:response regulator transcription factor [Rhodomicrobium sp.]
MDIHKASLWPSGEQPGDNPPHIQPETYATVIRLAIFDDHPIMRQGLLHTFEREPGFEIVGEGGSAAEAVRITEAALPDIVLLDINMPGDGVAAARTLSRSCPAVRIVMLTAHDSEEYVVEALRGGASGYIVKGVSSDELIKTVRAVHDGEGYVSPGLAAKLLGKRGRSSAHQPPSPPAAQLVELTSREEEILRFVCEGQSNREIGNNLGLTEKTIKHYMTNILQKLHARNRVEAALIARDRLGGSL